MRKRTTYRYRRGRRANSAIPTPILLTVAIAALGWWAVQTLGASWEWNTPTLVSAGLTLIGMGLGGWWLVQFCLDRWRRWRWRQLQLYHIDHMSGHDFEYYVAEVLRFRGCTGVQVTRAQGDFGVDIVFRKDGWLYAAQVKRYQKQVGIEALYQAAGGREYYHADRFAVITNSTFTPAAQEFARKTKAILVDRDKLTQWIGEFQQA